MSRVESLRSEVLILLCSLHSFTSFSPHNLSKKATDHPLQSAKPYEQPFYPKQYGRKQLPNRFETVRDLHLLVRSRRIPSRATMYNDVDVQRHRRCRLRSHCIPSRATTSTPTYNDVDVHRRKHADYRSSKKDEKDDDYDETFYVRRTPSIAYLTSYCNCHPITLTSYLLSPLYSNILPFQSIKSIIEWYVVVVLVVALVLICIQPTG